MSFFIGKNTLKGVGLLAVILILMSAGYGFSRRGAPVSPALSSIDGYPGAEDVAGPDRGQAVETDGDGMYEAYRLDRDRLRSEQLRMLNDIVGNELFNEANREEAQRSILWTARALDQESRIENALSAKGFRPCVADVQPERVLVIVPGSLIRQDNIAQVADLVTQVSGQALEDIIVIPGQ